MSTYHFTWWRSSGWTRLGLVGAVVMIFFTPMLWALGAFGQDESTLIRSVVFLGGGLWLSIGAGYTAGWAMRGFLIRQKEPEADDGGHHGPAGHPPAHGPAPHRPNH